MINRQVTHGTLIGIENSTNGKLLTTHVETMVTGAQRSVAEIELVHSEPVWTKGLAVFGRGRHRRSPRLISARHRLRGSSWSASLLDRSGIRRTRVVWDGRLGHVRSRAISVSRALGEYQESLVLMRAAGKTQRCGRGPGRGLRGERERLSLPIKPWVW